MSAVELAGALRIDCAQEAARIERWMVDTVARRLRRRGAVIALSGGVDSSVCGYLAARAFGKDKVFGLLLPERESSPASTARGKLVAERLGIAHEVQDIGPALDAVGCYARRDAAVRSLFPDYGEGWKCKIAITGGTEGRINAFRLIVRSPGGEQREARLPLREYLEIVAATNYKQRLRKAAEYFHADRLNYCVIGTPNRLEYDQGFFVKNGDGAADLKPIAHLYKTQVYALAEFLGVPEEIRAAAPSTDTYSLPQGQDEFYFALPYAQMDVALWAHEHGVAATELARFLGVEERRAQFIYRDIEAKRLATRYLHAAPQLAEPVLPHADVDQ